MYFFRALYKLLRRGEALDLNKYFADALEKYDLTGFLVPFINTLFDFLNDGKRKDAISNVDSEFVDDEDKQTLALNYLVVVLDLETMNDVQAAAFIRACLDKLLSQPSGRVPAELTNLVRATVLRSVALIFKTAGSRLLKQLA